MLVLGSAMLMFEAIVVLLAIPVALTTAGRGAGAAWAAVVLALLAVVTVGLLRRDPKRGVQLGWIVQLLLVAAGLIVPAMFFLGPLFAAIWWAAIHYGAQVDVIKAQRLAAPLPAPLPAPMAEPLPAPPPPPEQPGEATPPAPAG